MALASRPAARRRTGRGRSGAKSIVWVSALAPCAGRRGCARVMDEQRDVDDLLVEVHPVLGPEIVLAEQEAVVGGDDQGGVLPQVVLVEIVEQLAQQEVAQRDHRVVVGAQLLAFVWQLVDAAIARPVADRAVPAGVEGPSEAGRRRERLMRIEGLDLQQPVVGIAVAVEELEAMREALDRREILLVADELAIDDVLCEILAALPS